MKHIRQALFLALVGLSMVLGACATAAPTPTATPPLAPATAAGPKAQVVVFSQSAPHVSVIDAETNQVVKTTTIPDFTAWTFTDDTNYYDGKNLWVGMRNPKTDDGEVVLLDLDTLTITTRIPVGKEKTTLYIGKPTKDGRLFVAKHASWQMAILDIKTRQLLKVVDVDVNAAGKGTPPGWANCDVDAGVGPDGVDRVFYPTSKGDTTVALDPNSLQALKVFNHPAGSRPCMLTVAPDGTIWVQECDANYNTVHNPVNLDMLARFSTGKGPLLASFSPDGKLGYIANRDTMVTVVDAQTYKVIRNVQVGSQASITGAHPNGKVLYVGVTDEAAVAAVDTTSWEVTKRIPLGTKPSGLYVRTLK